jgi:hypothetical protein
VQLLLHHCVHKCPTTMCFENPCLLGLVNMFSSTPEAHIEETKILQRISTYLTIRKYMWNATRMAKSMMFLIIILVCLTSYNTLTFKCYSNISVKNMDRERDPSFLIFLHHCIHKCPAKMCFENLCILDPVNMFSSAPEAHIEETKVL